MARKRKVTKLRHAPKAVLKLPDLDQAKSAVLNSLCSPDAQRGYRHAMDEFIECTVPSRDSHLAGLSSSAIGCIWSPANSPPAPSTCVSGWYVA